MRPHILATSAFAALLSTSHSFQIPSYVHCPPLGPVLPPPSDPSQNEAVQTAVFAITAAFQNLTSGLNDTAISIGVTSIHEDTPLLDLHWTPPSRNPNGTDKVDRDTIYRVGSISKTYTVLALLQLADKIQWTDPVTKYVPELRDLYSSEDTSAVTAVDWDEVTIEALASHLGDIPANFGFDLGNEPKPWSKYGLPVLNSSQVSGCGGEPDEAGCTRQTFFAKFGRRHPVYAPWTTPVYSNMGFAILGFVIESVTNQTYEEVINQAVLSPLNLTRTSVSTPTDKNVVEATWFGSDLGIEIPSGGYYASTSDLLAFGSAILNSRLLTPAQTRRWLKPLTHTSSLGISVGAPWEIARGVSLTADNRTIDIYTKSGMIGEYVGILALIPDYDLVLTFLSAGSSASYGVVYPAVTQILQALLPAVEQAGKAEANSTFAGTYQLKSSNTSITISVDDNGPGLKVSDWFTDGDSMGENWPVISAPAGTQPGSPMPGAGVGVRLYPTNLQAGNKQAWRAVFDTVSSAAEAAAEDAQLFFPQGTCLSWSSIDSTTYGLNGLDDFVFNMDETSGQASSVTLRGLRKTLVRV
ncbi:hypothetical protein VTN77DRAFT_7385 [Rasamsonia byssochlamydoides]|uniref:uncharacterized protein n=1 Tax=Rasamsonia byssochlamydoides TaxID=89139 RepID=UPI0037434997